MIRLTQRNKILIEKIQLQGTDRLKTFEIKLPANVSRISSIIVSSNIFIPVPIVFAQVSFQAQDKTDIFLVAEVSGNGYMHSDESFAGMQTDNFEEEGEWLHGKGIGKYPVTVEGDNMIILCTYKAVFALPFTLRIYAEYEEIEKLDTVSEAVLKEESEQKQAEKERKTLAREI